MHQPSEIEEHRTLHKPEGVLPAGQPQSSSLVIHSNREVSQSRRPQCQYHIPYQGGNKSMASLYFL